MTPPAAPTPAPPPLDAALIGKLIEERIEKERAYLKFAQDQAKDDREYFKHLFDRAAWFIGTMIVAGGTIAGILGIRSLDQMKEEVRAEMHTAERKAQAELDNVRVEVQNRVNKEFESENIKALVRKAAQERTAKELEGIIRSEVEVQVARGIEQEKPTIKKAIEDETRRAVHDLEPTIKQILTTETQAQVQQFVAPVKDQMAKYGEMTRIGTLVNLANSGDRKAYDKLYVIASYTRASETQALAEATTLGVIRAKAIQTRAPIRLRDPQTPEELKKWMTSDPTSVKRIAAIDNYPLNDVSILPTFVHIINNDDNIDVVVAAFEQFDAITHQNFRFSNYSGLTDWWNKNKGGYVNK